MRCNYCDREIPEGSIFCPYCGQKAEKLLECPKCGYQTKEDFVFCPVCGSKFEETPHICSNCGNELQEGYSFCTVCGTRIDDNPIENKQAKPKKSNAKGNSINKKVSAVVNKFMSKSMFVERILFAVVAAVIFLCSFFGVVSLDMTDYVDDYAGSYINLEGDVKLNMTAIDLIEFSFFAANLDKESASKYLTDREVTDRTEEINNILKDRDFVEIDDLYTITVNKKGCSELSKIFSKYNVWKISYAQSVAADEERGQSTMLLIKIAGFLCLGSIIFSSIMLIMAIVGLVAKKNFKASSALTVTMLGIIIFIYTLFAGLSGPESLGFVMGAGFVAIIVFALIYILWRVAMHLLAEQKINWQTFMAKATSLILGIIIICLFASPAVKVVLPYNYHPNEDENYEEVEFSYEFTQSDLFEEYFLEFSDNNRPLVGEINTDFTSRAQIYAQNNNYSDGDEFFKQDIGLNVLLQNDVMHRYYQWATELCKIQPILFLFSLLFSVILLLDGISGLCGIKVSGKLKYFALAIIIIAAIYSIIMPMVIDGCLYTTSIFDRTVSVGSGVVTQLVFAIIGIVVLAFSRLLKGKELDFNKIFKNRDADKRVNPVVRKIVVTNESAMPQEEKIVTAEAIQDEVVQPAENE